MKNTLEQEVELLREAIHNAMTHLEKDNGIHQKNKNDLVLAYMILEHAFMDTAHGYSIVMSDLDEDSEQYNLINSIIDTWLGETKAHLYKPQIKELAKLSTHELERILKLDPDAENLSFDEVGTTVLRMKKRRKIAQSIREAEEKGLYEISEHLSDAGV